jgi:NADPH-dependent 2,4-dienoyl-CoA reductase/sulfur reductase-like enzyme
MRHVVIVGASLAGLRAAETLRQAGFDGDVTLVGAEPHLPYDRPPLSKQVLAGEWEPDRIGLRPTEVYDELQLDLRLGRTATALDLAARRVVLDGDEPLPFDGLVIATGAVPRSLPGTPPLAGIHVLRTVDDCLAIRADLDAGPRRVVVVGAGFIGAEVAATARRRGLAVTILEALPVPLGRALGEEMGRVCAQLHRDEGVDLRLGVGVSAFEGTGRVEAVRLADGSRVEADVVVVGIGVRPATDWLEGSGVPLGDGVVCDERCAVVGTSGVVAAGDVARWPNRLFGEEMRVEHWTNAVEQGDAAARNLLAWARGEPGEPFAPVPYFWSDQYDTKIQFVGRARPDDRVEVVRGSVAERKFVAIYGREGRIVGCLGFSMPRWVMQYRRLIAERATWDDALALATA